MESQDVIKSIAEIILDELKNIDRSLEVSKPKSVDVFAYPMRPISQGRDGEQNLARIQTAVYSEYTQLKRTPFIAYAKVTVNGEQRIYFFTRNFTPSNISPSQENVFFVNYKSPMGRIVELEAMGDDIIYVPAGEREVLLLEKNLFKSVKLKNDWDAIQNNIFLDSGTFTIPSLLEFLKELKDFQIEIELADIQEREVILRQKAEEKVRELSGLQRQVIEKMELRDQPVLDQKQGEIFRLPLASKIILTGAPGTGKTTTLIKRIAQKISPEFLEQDELNRIPRDRVEEFINPNNWIMFTPTELLKIFVKEALNREYIAASDLRVKVWSDEREKIARESLGILKTGDKGYFRKTRNKVLPTETNSWMIDYAQDFIDYYTQYILDLFYRARQILNENATAGKLIARFNRIEAMLKEQTDIDKGKLALILINELRKNRDLFNQMNLNLRNDIDKMVINILKSLDDPINIIFEIIESYQLESDIESESDEEFQDEEVEIEPETEEKAIIVKRQLARTLRYFAQRKMRSQSVSKINLHGRILGVIEAFLPDDEQITRLGKRIIDIRVSNLLTRGYSNLLSRIPFYYHQYRNNLIKQGVSWIGDYFLQATKEKRICENEIDLLVFSILRNARKIFEHDAELLDVSSRIDILEAIKECYVTQIVVDEATDFSTIQLGCMFNLSHPRFTSVTFSGDLMQRVTEIGLNRWEECQFISPSIEMHKIEKVYRQSPKLIKIAKLLYENNVGEKAPFYSAFLERSSEPEPLKFDTESGEEVSQWVTDRIIEIYQIHGGKLPSTAIFVAEDDLIPGVFDIIQDSLEDNSISIKGCPRGETLGSEGKVRIFSVKYIKGLEFESVFFLDINEIASSHPQLFDKYVYVGLTRAASFLGVTYKGNFPHKIRNIEPYFSESTWRHLART